MKTMPAIKLTTKEKIENSDIDMTKPFALVFAGGTISNKIDYLIDNQCRVLKQTFASQEEAKTTAKCWNKMLSPGKKGYNRMKYSAVKMNIKNYS